MAGAQGSGSALILRAKEARLRAQTADSIGLSTPLPTGQPGQSVRSIASMPVAAAQPIQPPTGANLSVDDMMYGHVDQFLKGLANTPGGKVGPRPPQAQVQQQLQPPTAGTKQPVTSPNAGLY